MKLFDDQQKALDRIESETLPIFVTGAAGTGKSQLLRHLRDFGRDAASTEVVAFTGAAAVNVEGRTIHNLVLNSKAWSQSIQAYVPLKEDRELRKSALQELAQIKTLIIDEVSMVRADMIDALDRAFRKAKDSSQPFGGVRLVMFGDLRQLPPFVVEYELKNRERRFLQGYENPPAPYFFMAHVFSLTAILKVELTIQKRVIGDDSQLFIDALNGLRRFPPDPKAVDFINMNSYVHSSEEEMFLFAKRKPAAQHNLARLHSLGGESKIYPAQFRRFEDDEFDEEAAEISRDDFPAPKRLELRVGARVMVVANLNVAEGLVNGATGTVEQLRDKEVVVRLDRNNRSYALTPHSFDWKGLSLDNDVVRGEEKGQSRALRKTKIIGSYLQVPLTLAWGVTIHKAQGATLERATIDFDSEYHSAGQAYVAISRLRSVSGLSRKGTLGNWHFSPYSRYVEEFETITKPSESPVLTFEEKAEEVVPWRSPQEVESLLDNYLELIPQVRDYHRFSHRRRMQYLRDEGLMSPSTYLRELFLKDPHNAIYLYRNIDRALRNKPLILSAEVLGDDFDSRLRDVYEISASDQRRLEFWCGDDWPEEALKGVGQGDDVATDVIPEYEIEEIEFASPSFSWKVFLVPEPASRERLWEYEDPQILDPKNYPKYPSLGRLLNDVRGDWDSAPRLLVNVVGTLSEDRLQGFLPYLGVFISSVGQVKLNGEVVLVPLSETLEPEEATTDQAPIPLRSVYPEQRFAQGEPVLLSIGAHSGKVAVVLQIKEVDYVQYLTVQPEGFPDPITIRGNYATRIKHPREN